MFVPEGVHFRNTHFHTFEDTWSRSKCDRDMLLGVTLVSTSKTPSLLALRHTPTVQTDTSQTHTNTRAHIHTLTHTHAHTHIHTRTHARTHTHTHCARYTKIRLHGKQCKQPLLGLLMDDMFDDDILPEPGIRF